MQDTFPYELSRKTPDWITQHAVRMDGWMNESGEINLVESTTRILRWCEIWKFVNLRRYSHHSRVCVHQFIILISWFLPSLDSLSCELELSRFYFMPCYGYWILLEINLILCSIIMRPFSSPFTLSSPSLMLM